MNSLEKLQCTMTNIKIYLTCTMHFLKMYYLKTTKILVVIYLTIIVHQSTNKANQPSILSHGHSGSITGIIVPVVTQAI